MITTRRRRKRILAVALLLFVIGSAPFIIPSVMAEICIRRSEALIQNRCFARSLIVLQSAAGWSPDNPRVCLLQARCSRYLEDWIACSQYLAAAETCGLPDSVIRRERMLCDVQRGEFPAGPDTTYSQVMRTLESDTSVHESIVVGEAFVTGYLRIGDTERAERLLDAWSADSPQDADLYHFRAKVCALQLAKDEALEWLQKACNLAPKRPDLRIALGNMLVGNQQFEAAAESFADCLEILASDPGRVDDPSQMQATAQLRLARCEFAMGNLSAAERLLQGAALLRDSSESLLLHGKILVARAAYGDAAALFQKALTKRSWDAEIRYALGTALRSANQSEAAAEHFEFISRAGIELERAEQLMKQAVSDPTNVEIKCDVASILLKYADPMDAKPWIDACLRLQPQHVHALQLQQQLQQQLSAESESRH